VHTTVTHVGAVNGKPEGHTHRMRPITPAFLVVLAALVAAGERLALAVPAFAAIDVVLVAARLAVGLINVTKVANTPAQPIAPARQPVVAAS
jgi:hypothetical protein